MAHKTIHWVNSPVLFEAIIKYEQGLLPGAMKLWVEELLELKNHERTQLLQSTSNLKDNL